MTGTVLIGGTIVRRARILEKPLTEAGFRIVIAMNRRDGVALCRRRCIDVVLLEALQPDLEGTAPEADLSIIEPRPDQLAA